MNYTVNGVEYKVPLGQLSKEIVFNDQSSPKSLTFVFSNDEVVLNKTISVENTSYPFTVDWTLTPLKSEVHNVSLYLTTNFDLRFHFDTADIPGLLDWINPWDAPAPIKTTEGNVGETDSWAVASFAGVNLRDNYLGLYDGTDGIGFAVKFNDLPSWGNIGALGNRQIDAVSSSMTWAMLQLTIRFRRSYPDAGVVKEHLPNSSTRRSQRLIRLQNCSVHG